ncbi:MAG: FAD-dependent oxidoreductase, partial [Gemmatimonadota bacterium]
MESTSAGPTGPDLQAGVPLDSLEEGRPLAGHVGDDAVLLTRFGAEVVAIGATCTHYSGPLAEGLTTDGVVRCPWHHACFSLRTGEAVGPPALNPLPRYRTIIEAGRARVGELLPAATSSRTPAARPRAIAIIGAGAAGAMAAETVRKEGYDGPITLIDPDAAAPYDRPNLSKDFLAGIAPEEWLPLRTSDFYAQHEIERVVASAQSIDAARRAVLLSDGRAVEFDVALLATGATPVRPPIPGNDGAHVHVLRSLADCRRLIDAARPGTRAVIAGASFIGMEAAAALRAREVDVTVVAPEATPFARTLGEELGGLLRARHEQNGVSFRLGRTLAQIGAQTVKLDDGTPVPADFVLLGVGVRPALDLARSAGLALDNGVLVDEYLESSVRGIYAAG